ncbi:class I SAM-dependent methyltransferase [Novispirillum itersonii]|uniref:class I SAM-dependent methyltransferase n=1 Tax=Novispirillum itersonii TaxID=189 RepID=UPI00037E8CBA|nr:class I SAM-dependent methyltransferase [Novispirillum itersonii]
MTTTLHDRVARTYSSDTGLIAAKNRMVLHRQRQRWSGRRDLLRVADLGVGDGALLEALSEALEQSPDLRLALTGLDISPAMLTRAAQRVTLTTVQSCASRSADHLPLQGFDLVLAHFILAYVDRRTLLQQARQLLAPGGILSLATSTNEGAAPLMAQINSRFRVSRNPLRRIIARATDHAFSRSSVPATGAMLEADAAACGLRLISRDTLRHTIVFQSAEEAYRFAIEDGWCVNVLAVPGIPPGLGQRLTRAGLRLFQYPFTFTQVVEMMEFTTADTATASIRQPEAASA